MGFKIDIEEINLVGIVARLSWYTTQYVWLEKRVVIVVVELKGTQILLFSCFVQKEGKGDIKEEHDMQRIFNPQMDWTSLYVLKLKNCWESVAYI